jgi:hypothetical protein
MALSGWSRFAAGSRSNSRLAYDGCGDRYLATDDGVRGLGRRVHRMENIVLVLVVLVEELLPIIRSLVEAEMTDPSRQSSPAH